MSEWSEFKRAAQEQLAAMPRSYRSLSAAQGAALEILRSHEGVAQDLPRRTVRLLAGIANRPIRLHDGSTVTVCAHRHGGWYAA